MSWSGRADIVIATSVLSLVFLFLSVVTILPKAIMSQQVLIKPVHHHDFDFGALEEMNIDGLLDEIDTNQMETQLHIPQIANNELEKEKDPIGTGKFGKIFKGRWKNKTVAIKEYQNENDYVHELSIIKHIHSAQMTDKYAHITKTHGTLNNTIVSELMPLGSADKLLYTNSAKNIRNQLNMADIVDILMDVCKGVMCLHHMGIIHRDLSARNLLFRPSNSPNINGKKFIVKLCDFGESQVNKNQTDSRKGPYLWLSPESIRRQVCNVQTDIYSFGILCYELIIGARPFPNTSIEVAVIEILCLSMRPNMSAYRQHIPLILFILIQCCLQQIPAYRPDNFEFILKSLQKLKTIKQCTQMNTNLDAIVFDKATSKELLISLPHLISVYLSDEVVNDSVDLKEMRDGLLRSIFNYQLNEETDLKAINFYLCHWPWGENKTQKQQIKAVQNVDKFTKQFGVILKFSAKQ